MRTWLLSIQPMLTGIPLPTSVSAFSAWNQVKPSSTTLLRSGRELVEAELILGSSEPATASAAQSKRANLFIGGLLRWRFGPKYFWVWLRKARAMKSRSNPKIKRNNKNEPQISQIANGKRSLVFDL